MYFIAQKDRHQMTFMSSRDDLVRPDHPVRIIDLIVDRIVSANPEESEYKVSGRLVVGPMLRGAY